eukprot:3936335-Rhodomonas_salina.3
MSAFVSPTTATSSAHSRASLAGTGAEKVTHARVRPTGEDDASRCRAGVAVPTAVHPMHERSNGRCGRQRWGTRVRWSTREAVELVADVEGVVRVRLRASELVVAAHNLVYEAGGVLASGRGQAVWAGARVDPAHVEDGISLAKTHDG